MTCFAETKKGRLRPPFPFSSHATMLQNAVSLCPGSSRVIPLLSPRLLRHESPSPGAFCLKSCANRQGSLSARQQKALPAYADSAFPYSYEYHLVPALALKDSFLHSLFYRAFHTVLCLFANIRVALSCVTRKGSQSGPERHLVGNGLLYFGKSLREAATVSATAALLLCRTSTPQNSG